MSGDLDGQSEWAWRIPLIIQGVPAIILAIGIWFMPFSPRWLMNNDREEEASKTLAKLRNLPEDHELVQIELLEIKAEVIFERQAFAKQFPSLANGSTGIFKREAAQYANIFRTKDSFKRVAIGSLVMFFQQWSGIDSSMPQSSLYLVATSLTCAVIYYAPIIFQSLGLTSATTSLLATGITGVINVAVTVPAIMFLDKVGRKPLALASNAGMFICQLVVGIIVAVCSHDWDKHAVAGWVAVVFVWLCKCGTIELHLFAKMSLTCISCRHRQLRIRHRVYSTQIIQSACATLTLVGLSLGLLSPKSFPCRYDPRVCLTDWTASMTEQTED